MNAVMILKLRGLPQPIDVVIVIITGPIWALPNNAQFYATDADFGDDFDVS